jgi:hypothetical protein
MLRSPTFFVRRASFILVLVVCAPFLLAARPHVLANPIFVDSGQELVSSRGNTSRTWRWAT